MKNYTKLDETGISEYLFHPRKELKCPETATSFNIDIHLQDNTLLGCRCHLHDIASPTIIYFHGNGETVADYDAIAPRFTASGLNLFVATYRGYGWSSGSPSAHAMMNDCREIFESFSNMVAKKNMTGPLFVMGRSIGSAPAVELCTLFAGAGIKGLIIESGFADTLPLLEYLGCDVASAGFAEEDGFGNRTKISEITIPTLFLHGAADAIIPIPQAERLQAFSGARTKKFFVIPGADHNNVLACGGDHYFGTIKGFIDEITGEASWRKRRKKYRNNG